MLSVKGICKSIGDLAIKDISFDVEAGQYFVLLGASGVGKSVLLATIAGLVRPDCGKVYLDGKDVTGEKIQNRRISLVFQDSTLFPHMTVFDNIAYPLQCKRLKGHRIRRRVGELAEDFEVTNLLDRNPQTLSGGETQRVSLARAVASEPLSLLLDEPISSLDVQSRPQIRALLRKITTQGKQQIVHVTHDYTEAVSLGTHIAVMEAGRIAQAGTVKDVFLHPKSEFVARFVGIRNFFKGSLEKSDDNKAKTKRFTSNGIDFSVLSDSIGCNGYIMIRSEDVTISKTSSSTSARNNFKGTVVDIVPAGNGVEIIVDVGLEIAAMLTEESVKSLKLQCGKKVWVGFKASAVKFVEG